MSRQNVEQHKKHKHHRDAYLLSLHILLLAAFFVGSLFFQSNISFGVGTLAASSDFRFNMIGDLVQNIRFIFLPLISCRKTYPKGTKDLQISSGTIEPFLDIIRHSNFVSYPLGSLQKSTFYLIIIETSIFVKMSPKHLSAPHSN